eukprot:TRINITY_DN101_c8_g1_i2.p1 TRINITY_DN101_c8_g1~~TRINITY_DN101_c8_g1_i2.p1  ORF type:complete len:242 (-),score=78.99 TRINITY_DN101_c8_g1_i2:51-776(-)
MSDDERDNEGSEIKEEEDSDDVYVSDYTGSEDEEEEEEEEKVLSKLPKRKAEVKEEKSEETKGVKRKEPEPESDKEGVLYIGHLPHGFYEKEVNAYFSQFGKLKNLRLSRNLKTGAYRGYGFMQFQTDEVAKIVAKSMDNYILFGKVLKVKVMKPEEVSDDIWIGSNKELYVAKIRDKRARVIKREKARNATHESQQKTIKKLVAKDEIKRKKLAKSGIDYEFPGYTAQASKQHSTHTVFD